MFKTPGGTEIYTRQEAIDIGEDDPGEGSWLLVFTRHSDGEVLSLSSCIEETYSEGEGLDKKSYSPHGRVA